ncbi:twin-arginine translocase TatA/TatE family subunit [Acidianus brierleyi]|uniref:Translocase n=1 Tax=Acidianus brierleyi TaxID=41673 RepID=A0A2U9IIU2_9CREN|nr:twin-arginine translocase TatA/TatE family subunit [Acidianus brierleyi]AWR95854.1 translocase [Acidianus brierleyi]
MLSNISDMIIIIIVGILLLGGEKDISGTVRNLGRTFQEFKKRQEEFRNELTREINNVGDIPRQAGQSLVNDVSSSYSRRYNSYNQEKINQLEEEIRKMQAELERLKKNGGKN